MSSTMEGSTRHLLNLHPVGSHIRQMESFLCKNKTHSKRRYWFSKCIPDESVHFTVFNQKIQGDSQEIKICFNPVDFTCTEACVIQKEGYLNGERTNGEDFMCVSLILINDLNLPKCSDSISRLIPLMNLTYLCSIQQALSMYLSFSLCQELDM